MENFNESPLLDNLNAGRDFADYLIANGWNITELFATGKHSTQSATFQKDNVKIKYIITDKESSFFTEITVPQLRGWRDQSSVTGPDLEGDVAKFAFLCHALGWVSMKEANKNCKAETNLDLLGFLHDAAQTESYA